MASPDLPFECCLWEIEDLKVQPCKLYIKKYMIASTQIKNTEIFAFLAVPVFKLLSFKVLFKRQ